MSELGDFEDTGCGLGATVGSAPLDYAELTLDEAGTTTIANAASGAGFTRLTLDDDGSGAAYTHALVLENADAEPGQTRAIFVSSEINVIPTLQIFNGPVSQGEKIFEWVCNGIPSQARLEFIVNSEGDWIPAGPNLIAEDAGAMSVRSGLLAFWKMDEATAAPRLDASGNGYALNDNGGVVRGTGRIGYGATFNGTTQYLSRGTDPISNRAKVFVVAWVKTTFNAAQCVLSKTDSFFLGWDLISSVNRLQFAVVSGGTSVVVTGAVLPNDGNWHMIAAAYDGVTIAISLDNGDPTLAGQSGPIDAGTGNFRIGLDDIGRYMHGSIDAVGIWNAPEPPAITTTLYNAGLGLEYPFAGA